MFADLSILEHLPNGGAVVAVIAVVVLFLKQQERSADAVQKIVDVFMAETAVSRKEYREHITEIMHLGLAAHHETRDAIRALGGEGHRPGVQAPSEAR
jgi:hypothetical protein